MAVPPAVNGPPFVFANGIPLTRDRLVEAVRHALQQAEIPAAGTQETALGLGLPHLQASLQE